MEARITPTEKIETLRKNLEKRVESIERQGEELSVTIDRAEKLERIPGIESFTVEGEKREGLKGKPVEEPAYARLESRKDAVRAFLATVEGYNLIVLSTERPWDLRQLRRYNPDIKHLSSEEPVEALEVDKSLQGTGETEKIEIETPAEPEIEEIYRERLT